MKISQLIEDLHGLVTGNVTGVCDSVKCGNADAEITGVGVTMFATPEVVRKAKELNINFIIVHEPLCYNHLDDTVPYEIGYEKRKLLADCGITVFRFHDLAHSMTPDLIYDGQLKFMNLDGVREKGKYYAVNRFILEQEMTAAELAKKLETELGLCRIRIAGCTDKKGKYVSCCFGTPGHVGDELAETDFVLTGEICEWSEGELARDYAQLGYNKAILVMGHIGSEFAGMKLLAEMLDEKYTEFSTTYIGSGELYSYTH